MDTAQIFLQGMNQMQETGNLHLLGTGLQAGAKVSAGIGAWQEGRMKNEAAKYAAAGYERQGTEEVAAATRAAAEERRKTDRLISKQIAIGAASGSAVNSPGILDIIGDTAQEGSVRARGELYTGMSKADGLKDKANLARLEGKAARLKGINQFTGSILEGATTYGVGMDEYRKKYKHG
jgi:hypothetical protein